MAEAVTIDEHASDDNDNASIVMIKEDNNNNKDIRNNNNGNPFVSTSSNDELQLSDLSNSQHTTTHNTDQTTPHNSDSNPSIHSPINNESKSNTELSIDADSASMEEEDAVNDEIINELLNDSDNLIAQTDENNNESESPIVNDHVSRAYRKLLVHESNRLKAENGRLLRKVEKMRCIRSSMQNIFNQLQNNDDEMQTIAHRMDDIKEEQKEQNNNQHEERRKLRQQRLLRFTKTHRNNKLYFEHILALKHNSSTQSQIIDRTCSHFCRVFVAHRTAIIQHADDQCVAVDACKDNTHRVVHSEH